MISRVAEAGPLCWTDSVQEDLDAVGPTASWQQKAGLGRAGGKGSKNP